MQDGGELSTPAPPRAPTVDEGPVQPLDVVVVGEGEQHLVADDGEGEQQHGAQRHGQGEGAQPQPARDPTWVSELEVPPQGTGGRGAHLPRRGRGTGGTHAILLTAASSSSCTAEDKRQVSRKSSLPFPALTPPPAPLSAANNAAELRRALDGGGGSAPPPPQQDAPQGAEPHWDRGREEQEQPEGFGSVNPPTCCKIRLLLEVPYDKMAEDVEAGEEQGADLQAQRRPQRAALPPTRNAAVPRSQQLPPVLFSYPCSLPINTHGLHQGHPLGAHKSPPVS